MSELNEPFDWVELDFTGGLWTVGDYVVPPKGAAVMQDCYPLPTGGLRAWTKPTTHSRAGISDKHHPLAIFSRGGISLRSGAPGAGTDFYLMTARADLNQAFLWRWDKSDDVTPPTQWELLRSFATGAGKPGRTEFAIFQPTGSGLAVYLTFGQNGSPDEGLWKIDYATGTLTQKKAAPAPRALVAHQDRLLFGEFASGGTRLWFTNPGSDTVGAANFLDVVPDLDLSANVFAVSFFGELLLGKRGAPLTLVQGDITDPTVRLMSSAHHPASFQGVAETDDGIVFAAVNDGYYVTRTGVEVQPYSAQLDSNKIVGKTALVGTLTNNAGSPVFASPFFITPTGHIQDVRSHSWFRTSEFGGGSLLRPRAHAMTFEKHVGEFEVHLATDEEDFEILVFSASESQMTRRHRYEYQSPLLRHPSGRRLAIREVQIPCRTFGVASRVTVIINGVSRRIDAIPAGRQVLRFPFMEENEYLDIYVIASSTNTVVEAPIIETIRLGTQAGHLLAPESPTTTGDTANTPPVFVSAGNQAIAVGVPFNLVVNANDADGDPLVYSALGLPTGATFTPATRTFSWTPTVGQVGTHVVTFNVTDNISGSDDMVIEITVA